MIKNIVFNNFRLFNKKNIMFFNRNSSNYLKDIHEIVLGQNITVICGKNATGKSNLLGMLANSVQHKGITPKNTPLIKNANTSFTAPFNEIFKGSYSYDLTGPNRFTINFTDDFKSKTDYRTFRIAWQKNGTRFRIIPKKVDGDYITESKVDWPVIYLGLSRLYPIGETSDNNIEANKLNLNKEEKKWYFENYSHILQLNQDSLLNISSIDIKGNNKKRGFGINTKTYDYLTNSAGQDNIGQILAAILSFYRLKINSDSKQKYTGGLLLIDEFDATLHPISQNLLFDFLIKESKKLNLQIIITTHSLSLIKHISDKTYYNSCDNLDIHNNIELYYLNRNKNKLEIYRNPYYEFINNELLLTSSLHNSTKVKIYTEDDEAKWFLSILIDEYINRFDIISMKLGASNLLQFNKLDPSYFSKVLIAVDGDVKDSDINDASLSKPYYINNIIKLPGDYPPEKIIYKYLIDLESDSDLALTLRSYSINESYLIHSGPKSNKYDKFSKDREKFKEWFKDIKPILDECRVVEYWMKDHKDIYIDFINKFKSISNKMLKQLRLPSL